ncbi:hypothetical protein CYMTET_41613 [Cymbomonas tetramitiformis]|uniref:Uncharacterized protein n=1 Tax=Cymbomonas tetramitiformis TaxID=36881 RepID=A0AAE0C5U4_9CHLO|nr:hypothetical protein CYMTET_41613 [Cymbomonas tetramitiformis]
MAREWANTVIRKDEEYADMDDQREMRQRVRSEDECKDEARARTEGRSPGSPAATSRCQRWSVHRVPQINGENNPVEYKNNHYTT